MDGTTVAGSGVAGTAQELLLDISSATLTNKSSGSGPAGSHISSSGVDEADILAGQHQVITRFAALGSGFYNNNG